MATFVLVHGGWQGGWSWRRVVPHLRAGGHEVYTPTLTGLGEREHLLGCVEGLDTHVHDVLGVIECEDLEEVVLVGHSYGGVVTTAVAEVVAQKLSHLVYLDAWVPKDGQRMFDLMPQDRAEGYREAARVSGEGISIPPQPLGAFAISDEEDARWFASKLVLQPLKTYEVVAKVVTPALAYVVGIEQAEAKIGASEEITPYAVRSTMIFRAEDGVWKAVHRHADPITTAQPAESVIRE